MNAGDRWGGYADMRSNLNAHADELIADKREVALLYPLGYKRVGVILEYHPCRDVIKFVARVDGTASLESLRGMMGIEVLSTRALLSSPAYRQIEELKRIYGGNLPIDDTCP